MKINHCFFVAEVFRHNNPHFQKLQNWADLRQHSVSDINVYKYNLLKLDNFHFIQLHLYKISKLIHHNNN